MSTDQNVIFYAEPDKPMSPVASTSQFPSQIRSRSGVEFKRKGMLGFRSFISDVLNSPYDPPHITHANSKNTATHSQSHQGQHYDGNSNALTALTFLERDEAHAVPKPLTDPQSITPRRPPKHHIRLVPAQFTFLSALDFDPITLIVKEGDAPLSIGRGSARRSMDIAFNFKVISRAHAEIWVESGGKLFIRDTGSSSGTFVNFSRLLPPNEVSQPFQLSNRDVLQLGAPYQDGVEDKYKHVLVCVEMDGEPQVTPDVSKPVSLSTGVHKPSDSGDDDLQDGASREGKHESSFAPRQRLVKLQTQPNSQVESSSLEPVDTPTTSASETGTLPAPSSSSCVEH
jgi:pSer/pThr/pTyr-binding forkhead associated (FHA) protein